MSGFEYPDETNTDHEREMMANARECCAVFVAGPCR